MFNSGKVVTIDMTMVKIADSIAKSPSLSEEYTISPPRFLRLIPNPTIMKRREDRGLSEDDRSILHWTKSFIERKQSSAPDASYFALLSGY